MKVENITNSQGNKVVNQFIITGVTDQGYTEETFQSYETTIARKSYDNQGIFVELDRNKWDCSATTGRYRNQFLGETKAETQKKIDSGEYILTDLN